MKSLTNCENPSSSPLQGACSGLPKAACDPENYSESRHECTLEKNQPLRAKGSRNRNLMRLSQQFFEVFQRASRNFIVIIILNKAA